MTRDLEAEERVRKLLSLEPKSAQDFPEIERVLTDEIERAEAERRISHAIALKRRLAWLRRGR